MTHVPRYVPAKTNEGWPVIGFIWLLTALLIVGVTVIHNKTYRHPTDPVSPGGATPSAATH